MMALGSVWVGLGCLVLAVAMLLTPAAFNEYTLPGLLYVGAPAGLWLACVTLWSLRKEPPGDPAVQSRRLQAKVGIALTLVAVAVVYVLVLTSPVTPGGEGTPGGAGGGDGAAAP
ncbi:MAG: hypothetical protein C4547_15850 [Phycisphaerales bacterium]|nr:MAG: hypothetical protein C4547_15850 [Phycisphaerales bacterium]